MSDAFGNWSGVEYLAQVHQNLALSSQFAGGKMTKADPRFDPKMVEREMNEVVRHLYMKLAAADPSRIVTYHEFVYPSGVEYVTLNAEDAAAPGYPNPALIWPWLDLRQIFYRPTNGSAPVVVDRVNFVQFWEWRRWRWSYQNNAIYFRETSGSPGSSQDRTLRLFYTPQPEPIDVTSARPLARMPAELQDVIAKETAMVLLAQMRTKGVPPLSAILAERKRDAVRSVSQTIDGPESLTINDPMLDSYDNF